MLQTREMLQAGALVVLRPGDSVLFHAVDVLWPCGVVQHALCACRANSCAGCKTL